MSIIKIHYFCSHNHEFGIKNHDFSFKIIIVHPKIMILGSNFMTFDEHLKNLNENHDFGIKSHDVQCFLSKELECYFACT